MTHIVNFPTKKALKEAIANDADSVFFSDPSIINPVSGTAQTILGQRDSFTVTNHPKRSWFAEVKRVKGEIKVS